jgi:dTDP-4-amino-4,6-dideoxygalactose transaminase
VTRVHLSRADVTQLEADYVLDALRSGWVAPLGPHVDAFENEMAEQTGNKFALALSSGTAALHLALLGVGARRGTVVLCPTMTFAASANAIVYTGATPVFVDSNPDDGNVDARALLGAVDTLRAEGADVAAAIVVDLFGRCADYAVLVDGLLKRGVPLIEDAAESLGATFGGEPAGSFGRAGALSFNGNKVMTTSGGGMLISDDHELVDRARYLATQARRPVPWYEHTEVGYNYRLSNLLAALGRGQLLRLDAMIAQRRLVRDRYHDAIRDLPGIRLLSDSSVDNRQVDNCWLTVLVLDPVNAQLRPDELVARLDADDIEARFVWKPMHLQPVFAHQRCFVTGAAERLFERGVALPSGSAMSEQELDRVLSALGRALRRDPAHSL